MHFFDLYWIIMPILHKHGFHFSWMDLTAMIGIGGIFIWYFWWSYLKGALVPVNDTKLAASIKLVNWNNGGNGDKKTGGFAPLNRRTLDKSKIHRPRASPKKGMLGHSVRSVQRSPYIVFIFREYKKLKQKPYWGNQFWAKGYCVDTVGLDGEMIRKYVKYQEENERRVEQQRLF